MPTIGQIFKEARLKKNVTPSQAAGATRMKVQHIEALERDDFKSMAAPTYAKGFIRLYAEYLALDPVPLLKQYADQVNAAPPSRKPAVMAPPPAPSKEGEPSKSGVSLPSFRIPWSQLSAFYARWKKAFWVAGAAVLVLLLLSLSLCGRAKTPSEEPAVAGKLAPLKSHEPSIVEEPPEPYIEKPNMPVSKP
ncbi:MAG TPA: hypothetical protein DCZ95_03450 [Verrucomicrobia bacterium]|nr:MAG: hypothetical protein A2X46_01515 [Lentisphaerae bacterium GWF2_57_35]HBA83129.1 hypothetical protein [Verrucomicrobiota bacterium]